MKKKKKKTKPMTTMATKGKKKKKKIIDEKREWINPCIDIHPYLNSSQHSHTHILYPFELVGSVEASGYRYSAI